MGQRKWTLSAVATGACVALTLPLAASAQVPGRVGGEASRSATTGLPVPLKASPKLIEVGPAADGPWLVWSHDSLRKPRVLNAFAQSGGKTPVRLNERGTQGTTGGIDGHLAAYAQWKAGESSAVYVFNLDTGRRHRLPAGAIGDGASDPTISGHWLLYSREYVYPGSAVVWNVMLYNRYTHEKRRVASSSYRGSSAYPGQVNGHWACWGRTWYEFGESNVFRYNLRTKTTERIAGDETNIVSDPAIASDGTMYFVRWHLDSSGYKVGPADLVRLSVRGTETVVAQLASADDLFVRDKGDGSHQVLYQAGDWRHADVYEISDN